MVAQAVGQGTERGRGRRCLESVAFVALLIGIGLAFDMSPQLYVALTAPATILFQLYVVRRPLHEMWVRNGPALKATTIVPWLSALLAIPPAIALITGHYGDSAAVIVWFLCVIAGAVPASYVIRNRAPETMRFVFLCFVTAGLVGTAILSLNLIAEVKDLAARKTDFLDLAGSDLLALVESFVVLFPGYYLLEEVTFRGAIDSYVQRPGEGHGVRSAIFVSVLWGVWHFPVVKGGSPGEVIASMLILQGAVGPLLSYWWRRSGNLLVPAVTHDFLDSFRNAIGFSP
jgi:CAAX prenyl protease-like protein